MQAFLQYLDLNGLALAFNVALVAIFYLVARVLNARQTVALAFAFVPLLTGFALLGLVRPP